MTSHAREQLIETSLKLFQKYGFHSVGIDRILAESGIAKNALYRYFRSKNELILAVLRRQDEEFRNWFMREVERHDDPYDRLLAVFDTYERWSKRPEFFGCLFVKASVEFPDAHSPIHIFCGEHKHLVMSYIQELAASAGVNKASDVAAQWLLLLDGATTCTWVAKNSLGFRQAKAVAKRLLEGTLIEVQQSTVQR